VTLERWNPKNDFRLSKMTPEAFRDIRAGDEFRAKLVKGLEDAGAPILAGTDTPNPFVVPGFSLHEELARLVAAGLTPYQALQAATTNAAAWIGDPSIGRIAVGARADLVVLDADPLRDITATTKRTGVMVRGEWLTAKQLDDKLAGVVASFTHEGDRFAKTAPLDVPPGDVEFSATFTTTIGAQDVGAERLAVVKTKDGGRIIVAQAAGDPPAAAAASMKLELDKSGALIAYALDEDGKKASATRVDGKLHVVAAKPSDRPFPANGLIDGTFVALIIPFLARTEATLSAVQIAGDGELTDVKYTFDRKAKPMTLSIEGGGQKSTGTLAVDDKGFPLKLSVTFPFGTIVITRK
jgi:hypothetical protein